MGILDKLLGSPPTAGGGLIDLPPGEAVEVRGESHYLAAYEAHFGPRGEGLRREPVRVALSCSPDNPYDQSAVVVLLDGHPVGHIAREAAAVLAPIIGEYERAGLRPMAEGFVTGGWDDGDGNAGEFGITLSLAHPETLRATLAAARTR